MRRVRRALSICAGMLAVVPGTAAAAGITTHSAGITPGAQPLQVAAGPDGNVWFTEYGDPGRVARMTPGGQVTQFPLPTAGRRPYGITAGPDGNVWITMETGSIGRITPTGAVTEFGGLTRGGARDIVTGPDGNLWFTEGAGTGAVGRITPSGQVTEFTAGLPWGGSPFGITAGADGALWFALEGAGRLGRITPSGEISTFPLGWGVAPRDVEAGPDGNLWFTAPGLVGRMTPQGQVSHFTAGLRQDADPRHLVAHGSALYFTDAGEHAVVGRIDLSGRISDVTVSPTNTSVPRGIAAGPGGNLWVALPGSDAVAAVPPAPELSGVAVQRVEAAGATLAAELVAGGDAASWYVSYGRSWWSRSRTAETTVPAGTTGVPGAWQLDGLRTGSTYEADVVARNGLWTVSQRLTFKPGDPSTAGPAAPPSPDTGAPAPAPTGPASPADPGRPAPSAPAEEDAVADDGEPDLGRTVVGEEVEGRVLVRTRGDRGFRPLRAGDEVPVGSLVDASGGVVALESALPDGGSQTAQFRDGTFKVRQAVQDGLTELVLRGGNWGVCADTRRVGDGADVVAVSSGKKKKKRKRGKRVRGLWGKDDGGRYRTHGHDSSATVRGTEWLVADHCGGTLTKVREGEVVVRDRHTGRKVVVRAGESHFSPRRSR